MQEQHHKNETLIHISSGSIVRVLLLITLFFLIFYLRQTVMVFLAAVVIASAIEPAVNWGQKHRVPRILGVIIAYVLIIVFFAGVIYFLIPPLLSELLSLINVAPHYFDYSLFGGEAAFQGLKSTVETLAGHMSLKDALTSFGSAISTGDGSGAGGFFQTASAVFGGITSFLIIFVISFYLSAQSDGVEKFLQLITPRKNERYVLDLWRRTKRKIGYWLQGQFVLGVFVGLLVFIAMSIVGIRHALLLGVFSGIFEIIPVFGPIFGAIPGIMIALLDGGLTLGLLVAGLYTAIQQFESNIMYPLVVKKIVGIPPLLVILSLIIGFQLGGFLGAILAVPMATALVEYFDDVRQRRKDEAGITID